VNIIWIALIGLAVGSAAVLAFRRTQGRGAQTDLGSVSTQWVSEHRLGKTQESQR